MPGNHFLWLPGIVVGDDGDDMVIPLPRNG